MRYGTAVSKARVDENSKMHSRLFVDFQVTSNPLTTCTSRQNEDAARASRTTGTSGECCDIFHGKKYEVLFLVQVMNGQGRLASHLVNLNESYHSFK